ncbi:hypothetical protein [Streptomyces sp. H39-C1]|uniref:hypothetical protein n=1 Tax=Streptomyces sp. H39-C1 TaxID=3004355 RepID=UPI0022AEDA68|nr:hypothetical protein [Streptomyces sp. H39-C1]MCZ4102358.1 hypothetical protein [Streptomyces sp. H39-C1]
MPSPTTPPASTARAALPRPFLPQSTSAAGFLALAYAYLLAFNLLQQLAATTNAPAPVPYLFLGVIDGFITFAIYAAVRLRPDENKEASAWTMAVLAIIVRGITVLVLGVLGTRQSPGSRWQPADVATTWMSVVAPLILVLAVHLYALVTQNAADFEQVRER